MKKILLLTICTLMIMSLSSYATDTRVLTMGDNNNILMDDANIWLYPSRIFNYPDIATAEFSNYYYDYYPIADDMYVYNEQITRLGVNWKFGGDNPWVLGTYFHNNETFTKSQSDYTVHPYINQVFNLPNKRGDLFYGRMLGQNQFGFHFGFVHSSYSEDDGEDGYLDEANFALYNFEFGLTGMNGKLDLAAGIEMFTYKYADTRDKNQGQYLPLGDTTTVYSAFDTLKADGNMTLSLRGRYMYEYSPTYTFIPHLSFIYGKYKYEDYDWMQHYDTLDSEIPPVDSVFYHYLMDLNFTHEYKYTEFDLGIGMQYTPTTNVLAVIDFGVKFTNLKQEREYKTTGNYSFTHYIEDPDSPGDSIWVKTDTTFEYKRKMNYFPYFKVGVEADVFDWMDIRLGATSMWGKYTYEYSDYDPYNWANYLLKYSYKYPYNTTYLGLGFNFNRLYIDCYVDPGVVLDGFNFISGSSNEMNYQISLLYEMF
ncbi:MAG: hypothetical protein ACOYVF_11210 [Candidatus Zixiibacteriota bacterium]